MTTPEPPPPAGDTTPPTVSITTPANGATVSGPSVNVAANASDNMGVAGVQFQVDSTNLGLEDTTSPYSIVFDSEQVPNGGHLLVATARDAAGNRTSSSVSVTVSNVFTPPILDVAPPTVSITKPLNGATISGSSVVISATASDNVGIVGVQFKVDGVNKGAEDTTSPYLATFDSKSYSKGNHTITATARDTAGNTQTAGITVKK